MFNYTRIYACDENTHHIIIYNINIQHITLHPSVTYPSALFPLLSMSLLLLHGLLPILISRTYVFLLCIYTLTVSLTFTIYYLSHLRFHLLTCLAHIAAINGKTIRIFINTPHYNNIYTQRYMLDNNTQRHCPTCTCRCVQY